MAITITGLILIVAALIYTLETYTPEAKLIFPPYIEAAYGQEQEEQQQEQQFVAGAPNDTMIVDSNKLLESIRTQLIYSRLEDYKLYENGTAEYTIRFTSPTGVPMNRTMEIITQHPYSADRGYIYNSSGIFTKDGSQELIIPLLKFTLIEEE